MSFLEELKTYFKTTPRETILKDWDETKEFDSIGLPMDDFLETTNHLYRTTFKPPIDNVDYSRINNKFSPKFSSGFFFTKFKICKKQLFQLKIISLTR